MKQSNTEVDILFWILFALLVSLFFIFSNCMAQAKEWSFHIHIPAGKQDAFTAALQSSTRMVWPPSASCSTCPAGNSWFQVMPDTQIIHADLAGWSDSDESALQAAVKGYKP